MLTTATQLSSAPQLHLSDGASKRTLALHPLPFIIGRAPECHLILTQPFISRRHAEIVREGAGFVLRDAGSRHGLYVNGDQATIRTLQPGDRIRFGSLNGPELVFAPDEESNSRLHTSSHDLLDKLQELHSDKSDLQKLRWFLQAAREMNSAGAIDRVMASLLHATLSLARVERGFVFLANADGGLQLTMGLDAHGNVLEDGSIVSRTVIRQAIDGKDQFLITDTLSAEGAALPDSIVAQKIRAVICIPLRQHRARHGADGKPPLVGLLYLDSRFEPAQFSEVDHELLSTIAREAAALVENAQLAVIEEQARKHAEEMEIAAGIQQGLMAVQIPRAQFADVQAHSIACSSVGGDFFDVLLADDVLSVALVDVSGKGISAAILASTLQGMLYVQLQAGRPLQEIAAATNDYLCTKNVGKYATMVLLRLRSDGELQYMNCGHVRPRLCNDHSVSSLEVANPPVGLLRSASFESATLHINPGARLLLVSDGFTEAEDLAGDFFGDEGLDRAARCNDIPEMLRMMQSFCAGAAATDDCTIVQIAYRGR